MRLTQQRHFVSVFAFLVAFIFSTIYFYPLPGAEAAGYATVDEGHYLGKPDIVYPIIVTDNATADGIINRQIRAEVAGFVQAVEREFGTDGTIVALGVQYEIACNNPGLLSIILTEHELLKDAAHPLGARRTLNFNSETGVRLTVESLSEIAKYDANGESGYSPSALTRKLRAKAEQENITLYGDFQQLNKTPENFYFDENLHVHFIFQEYEVAPYVAGFIDLDADAEI